MTAARASLLAIGLGNPLRGDDGVGVRVIEALERLAERDPAALPAGARLVAAGAPSVALLGAMLDARAVVLVDAADLGRAPGSVAVLRGHAVDAAVGRGDIGQLLVALRLAGETPPIALVAVQIGGIELGIELSGPVEAALPLAMDAARRELARHAGDIGSSGSATLSPAVPAGGVCA